LVPNILTQAGEIPAFKGIVKMSLSDSYQKALSEQRKKNLSDYVNSTEEESFLLCCKNININHEMTFFDGNKSIYQIRMIKDDYSGVNLAKDIIKLTTLKSLISNSFLYEKFVYHVKKHKTLKNPHLNYHYGFYYRKAGQILPVGRSGLNQDNLLFNRTTGEINDYQKMPEVKDNSVLELLIHAITPDYSAFMDWLAVYAMEDRKGLKKAHLALYGEYALPLILIIESIYQNGFYRVDSNLIPGLLKFNNWSAKCCFYAGVRSRYNDLIPFLDHMAQNIINISNSIIKSDTWMVFHINKEKPLKSGDFRCVDIKLYSKQKIEDNLADLQMTNFVEIIAGQIGCFCNNSLHDRYLSLQQDQDFISNAWGVIKRDPDKDLTDQQVNKFVNYIIKNSAKIDYPVFQKHYIHYLKTKILSSLIIEYFCIKFNIDYKSIVSSAKDLRIFSTLPLVVSLGGCEYDGFKVLSKIY